MKSLIPFLLSFVVLTLFIGCESSEKSVDGNSYLEHFKTVQPGLIEFTTENLPDPIKSPFDGTEVYPTGKIPSTNGGFITLITLYDGEEPLGEVHAELISNGQRKDKVTVAVADLGYHCYAEFDLPRITVVENYEDRKDDTTIYRVSHEGFDRVD